MINNPRTMAAVNVRVNPLGIIVLGMTCLVIFAYMTGYIRSPFSTPKVSMKEVLSASIDLAKRGGVIVKTVHESHKLKQEVKGQTKEGKDELMTEGDMKSHIEITHGFHKGFPELLVESEEHENQQTGYSDTESPVKYSAEVDSIIQQDEQIPASDITIWVDPLDATQEYTEGLLSFVTVMVCVAVKGKPVMGVIHKPFEGTGETFWGWLGKGYSANLKPLNKEAQKPYKVIRSRSHAGDVDSVVKELIGADTEITPAGGAGYKTLAVIQGSANAYVHVTAIKKWDICAGNAILETVGGKMTTLGGETIDYSNKGSSVNSLGLLATTNDHELFLKSFQKAADDLKAKSKV